MRAKESSKASSESAPEIEEYEFDNYYCNPVDGVLYGYNAVQHIDDGREKLRHVDARGRIQQKQQNPKVPNQANTKRMLDNRSKIRGLELKLKLTTADMNNYKNEAMEENLR